MNKIKALSAGLLAASLLLSGCGKPKVDYAAKFDTTVADDWKKNWLWVDADKFFQTGGLFIDSGEPGDPALDRPHIQPLLKRLRERHGLKWQAVVHKKKTKFAVALVAQLPSEQEIEAIKESLNQEDGKFPGEILRQFGHQYMALDFFTEEDLRWEREAEEIAAKKS
ncbi:MAG TPA: hypothetical protein VM510_04260 [Caulifigura sp.]|nr:hypothetical protein [Caulifigura sp.]